MLIKVWSRVYFWQAWNTLLDPFAISLSFWDNWWPNMVSEFRFHEILGPSLSIYIWSPFAFFLPFFAFFLLCTYGWLHLLVQDGVAHERGCWKTWYTLLGPFHISLSFGDNWWSNIYLPSYLANSNSDHFVLFFLLPSYVENINNVRKQARKWWHMAQKHLYVRKKKLQLNPRLGSLVDNSFSISFY